MVEGEKTPRYAIERQAVLGAWGSKCLVTAPADGDKEIALIDFHTLKYDLNFTARDYQRTISSTKRTFEASGGLGTLHWKDTGMKVAGAASWELRDETSLVMVAEVDYMQVNGYITLWREGLDEHTVEELVVVAISQIEEYKRMIRRSKVAGAGVAVNVAF
jgi:hypothetical protein